MITTRIRPVLFILALLAVWHIGAANQAVHLLPTPFETLKGMGELLERGLLVPAIRPPTVPEGTARLRISLSAGHTPAQVDRLVTALHEIGART